MRSVQLVPMHLNSFCVIALSLTEPVFWLLMLCITSSAIDFSSLLDANDAIALDDHSILRIHVRATCIMDFLPQSQFSKEPIQPIRSGDFALLWHKKCIWKQLMTSGWPRPVLVVGKQ